MIRLCSLFRYTGSLNANRSLATLTRCYTSVANNNNNNNINNNAINNTENDNDRPVDSSSSIQQHAHLDKNLRGIGVYLPGERDEYEDDEDNEEFDDGMDERDRRLLAMVEDQQRNNPLLMGVMPQQHKVDDYQSFEQLEERWQVEYEKKQEALDQMTPSDFTEKNDQKVELYNTISNRFSVVDESQHIHFNKPEDNQIPHYSDQLPDVNIESNDDLSTRISKIKQRMVKNKVASGRVTMDIMNTIYQLHREDPVTNNAQTLAQRFALDTKATESLLKYFTVPIIVKYNTGVKSGHWSVVFEK
ncbi:hypothetical protein SAMD00019534_079000 [Acytostelium subglobosum LB1]|uniref:hypothetical protein n=1 Tax=Acytostelium subglobosum LB1 TaxID=1410327 RepID=UPI000644C022|nr:hypothetical protein SAMD00019534_079000 [Acytostelium subglobosum LB1]GAM24725.1 hypothetical protein SAMD00019534_079000 [Acytostelium subglobosum LB1]|eukprot:XP_012752394.1 hypothetical protein SAMD00019534_079000 [Acytostelium subglobosum LB1]